MTIRRLTEIFYDQRRDGVIGEEKITELVNALEAKLCEEVFLTHEDTPPGVYLFMGYPLEEPWKNDPLYVPPAYEPHTPGYSDEWLFDDFRDVELLVKPPYDDIYRAYVQWRSDLAQNDINNAVNSQAVFLTAYDAFAKAWNRKHMPINKTPYRGYKE